MRYLLFIFILVACGKAPEAVEAPSVSGRWFRSIADGMEVVDVKDTYVVYYSCPTTTNCLFSFSTPRNPGVIELSGDTLKIENIAYKRLIVD